MMIIHLKLIWDCASFMNSVFEMKELYKLLVGFFIVVSICPNTANSQVEDDPDADEDELLEFADFNNSEYRGFFIGINFGGYFANKAPANFYNGQPPNDIFIYLNNPNIYNDIVEALGGYDFTLAEYADDLRYNPALMIGINMRYRLGAFSTVSADFNYANLRAEDVIVLDVNKPNANGTIDDVFEAYPIWGEEERFVMSLGIQNNLADPGPLVGYVELGGLLTSAKAKENRFSIGDPDSGFGTATYNILRPELINNQYVNGRQPTTTSFGFYGGLGVNAEFEKVILDFGYRASFERVAFREGNKLGLHHAILIKFLYSR